MDHEEDDGDRPDEDDDDDDSHDPRGKDCQKDYDSRGWQDWSAGSSWSSWSDYRGWQGNDKWGSSSGAEPPWRSGHSAKKPRTVVDYRERERVVVVDEERMLAGPRQLIAVTADGQLLARSREAISSRDAEHMLKVSMLKTYSKHCTGGGTADKGLHAGHMKSAASQRSSCTPVQRTMMFALLPVLATSMPMQLATLPAHAGPTAALGSLVWI